MFGGVGTGGDGQWCRAGAIRSGQAWRLSGQHQHDLRQLPFAEGGSRRHSTGVDKDGQHLKPPMGFQYYAHMTDGDLNDIVAYLRTVPAQE